jgi:hypothetical protein
MKKFMKFMSGVLVAVLILAVVAVGLVRFNDWPVFIRDPAARMRWTDGESKNRGIVYWKPFTEEYLAEIEIGAGVYGWAWLDRAGEIVATPESPNRIMGLLVLAEAGDAGLDPSPPEEVAINEWEYAFSSRMVTFNDGRYRCKVEF